MGRRNRCQEPWENRTGEHPTGPRSPLFFSESFSSHCLLCGTGVILTALAGSKPEDEPFPVQLVGGEREAETGIPVPFTVHWQCEAR